MEVGGPNDPAPGASSTSAARPQPSSTNSKQTTDEGTTKVRDQGQHSRTEGRPNKNNVSRGAGRGGRGDRQGKKRDMGRKEWSKNKVDKRQRNDNEQAAKRQRVDQGKAELPIYATKFNEEELAAEGRRPKKKVAVMIGYAGTGYKGMQFTHDHKTIEGDLFLAFVAAGAISKVNADDPKKSSFVRCARTDKGVHAAGNVISLKLIIEDEDIVNKINDNLVPQIRVWGFERTINSFSAYQLVDSRIYEYLIPTHSFLPPHPSSFLGKNCVKWAEKKDDLENYKGRQQEVDGYWEKVDEEMIKPILADYDPEIRDILEKALWLKGEATENEVQDGLPKSSIEADTQEPEPVSTEPVEPQHVEPQDAALTANTEASTLPTDTAAQPKTSRRQIIDEALKRLRQAYITAKRSYRIPTERLDRVQAALNRFVGTRNFHNYTIQKSFGDPSSRRVIKSFNINRTPILINGTEWLSMKVHGQSFMMHQIRKMVGMVALVVRCGCDPERMFESMSPERMSIPKAPSLGLLLERPVFDTYGQRAKTTHGKEPIDFDKFKTEMDEFKQTHIYERMYHDEEKENVFGNFFNHVDNFPSETFLFVTSGGYEATQTKPLVGGSQKEGQKSSFGMDEELALDAEDGDSDLDNVKDEHGNEG